MQSFLSKLTFDGENFNYQVQIALALIWLIILGCAYHSILCQQISASKKKMWMLIVTVLPVFGIIIYLPFSVDHEHLSNLPIWKRIKSRMDA